ncbi:hypothetical protein HPB51_007666 [Rhipicephalus microplus]|uniref:Uncharacterized protein n=1 Tax=Rhipicephalus microplus TaxID=6941 RepID=A0A9J6D8D2_RHIMP|nr:hypothetical protein HPB51_007666 [Rhipicephalus microplus]
MLVRHFCPATGLLVELSGSGLSAERCQTHSAQRVIRGKCVANRAQSSEQGSDEGIPRVQCRLSKQGRGGLVGEGLSGGRMNRRGDGVRRCRRGSLVGLSGRLALTAAAEERTSRHHTCTAALTALFESGVAAVASSVVTLRSSCQRGQANSTASDHVAPAFSTTASSDNTPGVLALDTTEDTTAASRKSLREQNEEPKAAPDTSWLARYIAATSRTLATPIPTDRSSKAAREPHQRLPPRLPLLRPRGTGSRKLGARSGSNTTPPRRTQQRPLQHRCLRALPSPHRTRALPMPRETSPPSLRWDSGGQGPWRPRLS